MGVKVKWTVKKDLLDQMKRNAAAVSGTAVEVGVLKGEHQWLAGIHEYGCTMTVTNKQRRYMMGKYGLLLGKQLVIPERSFLRAGYDKEGPTVVKHAAKILADVAAGSLAPSTLYESVGEDLSERIKDYANDLHTPPNHPFTVGQKNSSNPLHDTGDMIEGITWRTGKL